MSIGPAAFDLLPPTLSIACGSMVLLDFVDTKSVLLRFCRCDEIIAPSSSPSSFFFRAVVEDDSLLLVERFFRTVEMSHIQKAWDVESGLMISFGKVDRLNKEVYCHFLA